MTPRKTREAIEAGGRLVPITHAEKVLFPSDGITKLELAEYYHRIAPVMRPHLRDRPVSMERYPDGIHCPKIFQKNAPAYYPGWIQIEPLEKKGGSVRHVICNDAATLVYLANQAVITPHTWLSRFDQPHHPDQLIFDLDPSRDDFAAVCHAAQQLRERLDATGLTAFVKTTGSRGLHVLVPLDRSATFDEVRAFGRQIAEELVQDYPEHLTTEVRKSERRGRIFLDTGRNAYAQTAAPAYAVRPRDGAPVATPLNWNELDQPRLRPDSHHIQNIFERLDRIGDPWQHLHQHAQKLRR